MHRFSGALVRRCLGVSLRHTTAFFALRSPLLPLASSARAFATSKPFLSLGAAASAPAGSSTEHDVTITDGAGSSVQVSPLNYFADLQDAPAWLAKGLQSLQYPSTTDIQKYTIPLLTAGHDVIGLAPTGSGKTVAFAVPALKNFRKNPDGTPSVLVLAPTRELVQQTTKVFENLAQGQVRVCEAYGGAPREFQARRLHAGCDVLVATAGRLKDFLDAGDVSLKNLSFLVFDEADRLLDMGFQVQLDEIMTYLDTSAHPQTMMWSATWPHSVQALARNYLSDNRLFIRAGTAGTGLQMNEHIKQTVIYCNSFPDRIELLGKMVEDGTIDDNADKLIIFVERQSDTENTARAFSHRLGIDSNYVGTIHGGLPQRMRDRVMEQFKNNYIRLLVATDVASRGLDIPDVTCVVNFQAPKNIDSYCHRIGRTGRAGRSGKAYTFIGNQDGSIAADLADYLQRCNCEVPSELTRLAETQRQRAASSMGRFGGRGRGKSGYGGSDSRRGRGGPRRDSGNRFDSGRRSSRDEAMDDPNGLGW